MFDRYTERARRVIFFARYEASQFGGTAIESHHLLLGLFREDKNLLRRLGLSSPPATEGIREEIEARSEIREKVPTSIDLPLSNECKRILAYANEEAERLRHRHIGTEHLFLGILREENCLAAEILYSRGLRLESVREQLVRGVANLHGESALPHSFWLKSGQYLDVHALYTALETHHFTISKEHLIKSMTAGDRQDWQTALADLHLFLETLVDALRERADGEELVVPIVEGFEWTSLRELRSGLSTAEDDWRFQWRITLLLAELLLKRFEQLQDLEPE